MKKITRNLLVLVLAVSVLLCQITPALAADTAANMQLSKTEGTVTVCNATGRKLSARDDMRLYNGYTVETAASSYAWINLDSSKLMKLDASSKVEIRKSGKNLELLLQSGSIYGDVSKPLESDETLNIRTSTAIVGIRGTKFQVGLAKALNKPSQHADSAELPATYVTVAEGKVSLTTARTANSAGNVSTPQTAEVSAGQTAAVTVTQQAGAGMPPLSLTLSPMQADDLTGSAQVELTGSGDVTIQTPDGNAVTLTPSDAAARKSADEASARQVEAAIPQTTGQSTAQNQSTNPVWSNSSQGSSGGNRDSSGSGGSSSGRPANPRPVTPSVDAVRYTVTFDFNSSGTPAVTVSTDTNGRLTGGIPSTPARDGFTFAGWSTSRAGGAVVEPDSMRFTSNTTLYAQWTPVTTEYTVSFDANGGSVTPESTVTVNGKLTSLPSPVRENYLFAGWFTSAEGGNQITTDNIFTADTTIYAHWTAVTAEYIVTFDANGGSVSPASAGTVNGKLTTLPTPTRENYIFAGWFTSVESGSEVTTDTAFTADTTIYAHWTTAEYTVTFDANGGSVTPASAETVSGRLTTLPTPTREKYIFAGWFSSAESGEEVTADAIFTADTTIYAHWKAAKYTITFDANGGSVTPASAETLNGKLSSLPSPTRANCIFMGWFTSAEGGDEITTSTAFTEDTTIHAHWKAEEYTITFDVCGGAVTPSNGGTVSGKLDSLPAPEWEYHTFIGWFTSPEGGDEVTTDTVFTAGTTLYAHWAEIKYTVTFDANGGTVSPGSTETTNGRLDSLPTPTREHSTFAGWFTSAEGDTEVTTDTAFTEDTTVYAHWRGYTITFNGNSGSAPTKPVLSPASMETTDGRLDSFPAPTWKALTENIQFIGWYDSPVGGEMVPESTVFDGDTTLYAHWAANWDYNISTNTLYLVGSGAMSTAPWSDASSQITSVVIADGITGIGDSAFQGCTSLKRVTIPDSVTSIGASAFNFCSMLTNITIPSSVTSIGAHAFYECNNLTSVTIPAGVTEIASQLFYNCVNLKSVTIPSSVRTIENNAFFNCNSLTDVTYRGTKEEWQQIQIAETNTPLLSAVIHCIDGDYSYSEQTTFAALHVKREVTT